MTDAEGAYGFYNLVPNHYQVRLDTERLGRELTVASADAIDVELEATGRARTGIDFRVTTRQKPIVLQRTFRQ